MDIGALSIACSDDRDPPSKRIAVDISCGACPPVGVVDESPGADAAEHDFRAGRRIEPELCRGGGIIAEHIGKLSRLPPSRRPGRSVHRFARSAAFHCHAPRQKTRHRIGFPGTRETRTVTSAAEG